MLNDTVVKKISSYNIQKIKIVNDLEENPVIYKTVLADSTKDAEDAYQKLYSLIRPRETVSLNTAKELFNTLFFNENRYNLGALGRYRLNNRLKLGKIESQLLRPEDFLAIMEYLVKFRSKESSLDDIDHLGNRRVRSVGELTQNQFNLGFCAYVSYYS